MTGHMAGQWPMARNPRDYPVRLLQTGVLFLVGVWEWAVNPPTTFAGTMCAAMFMVSLLLAGMFPVPCNLLIVANFCFTCMFFDIQGPNQLLGVSHAIGTLTYDTTIWLGCLLGVPCVLALAAQTLRHPDFQWFDGYAQVPILTMLLLLMLFFSIISRRRSQLIAAKQEMDRADELKRRVETARMVHDSVTGDLSNIARIAQRQIRLASSPHEREVWEQVNDRSIRVLDSVHAVIRQLNTDDQSRSLRSQAKDTSYPDQLRRQLRQWQDRLDSAGIRGRARVIDHVHHPTENPSEDLVQRRECVNDIVNEACANIMKHGMPGDDAYAVTVTVEEQQIEVVATNTMFTDEQRFDEAGKPIVEPVLPGGNGIKLHRERIESLGGVLSADSEEGKWILYARVPRTGGRRHWRGGGLRLAPFAAKIITR